MPKKPLPETPAGIKRDHQRHVKRFVTPVPGNLAQADGHGLRMVITTHYECECGIRLRRIGRKKSDN